VRLGGYLPKAIQATVAAQADSSAPDPWEWARSQAEHGFSAAGVPLSGPVADDVAAAYVEAAAAFNLQIAEVGAWSNPLSPDTEEARLARERCQAQLALAEQLGARCCVNIARSLRPKWDGPFAQDLEEETFALVVDTVRAIIDAVRPRRTVYALETMPRKLPDSVDSYERLLRAVDRDAFAVHFDPVNLISSPHLYFQNGELIREFVRRLGDRIRCCHAKDIRLGEQLTVHLDEVRPGAGALDYHTIVTKLEALDPEMPLLIEHLATDAECLQAANHIRSVCQDAGVELLAPTSDEAAWEAR
jgi:sugar phosphate isomerase/epimerase